MTGHLATLVSDPAERERRRKAKREQVLRWLRRNTWSTVEILREVAGLGSRQAAHGLLQAMVRDGLVRKSVISGEFGPSVMVWGITVHGAAMAARQNEPISARTFEPSKIKLVTMSHSLDLQRLQLRAVRSGWGWEPVFGEFSRSEAKYADAVAVRPDGQKVAVEVERTVKTCKRYAEILVAHLAARKEGKWDWVYYLSPEQGVRDRVERAFHEIRHATWQQRRMKIEAVHLKPFRFDTYDGGWPEAV